MKIILSILILLSAISILSASDGMNMGGWYLSSGASGGISGSKLFGGGEVSAFYQQNSPNIFYFGMFTDVDRVGKGTRLIAGPEVGIFIFGCDAGYLSQWQGKTREQGYTVRPYIGIPLFFITERVHIPAIPVLNIFYRRTFVKNNDVNEFGFQFKFLVGLSK
jgi:hypothetical protein